MTSYFISIFGGNEDNLLLDYIIILISTVFFVLNILIIVNIFVFNVISRIPNCLTKVKEILNEFLLLSIIKEYKVSPVFAR